MESSSTKKSSFSLILLILKAILLKTSTLSSHPLVLHDKFATIPEREAPSDPTYEDTEPPPGAGDSLRTSSESSLAEKSINFLFLFEILSR